MTSQLSHIFDREVIRNISDSKSIIAIFNSDGHKDFRDDCRLLVGRWDACHQSNMVALCM